MNKVKQKVNTISSDKECKAIFSGQKLDYTNEEFNGCEMTAIFGGIDLDIRDAIIKEDITINVSAIFGGIDIQIPRDCNIKVTSSSIFGGVEDKASKKIDKNSKTIYINANCIFGGVELK